MSAQEILRSNVISTIENTLHGRGLLPTDAELDPARILVPDITIDPDTRTQTILAAHRSMRDLSVVFIRALQDTRRNSAVPDQDNKAHMSVRTQYSDQESETAWGSKITHKIPVGYSLNLSSPLIRTGMGQKITFSSPLGLDLSLEKGNNPFIVMPDESINLVPQEAGIEPVLLMVKEENNRIYIISSGLPQRWRSCVQNGRFTSGEYTDLTTPKAKRSGKSPLLASAHRHDRGVYGGDRRHLRGPEQNFFADQVLSQLAMLFPTNDQPVKTGDGGSTADNDSPKAKERYRTEKARKKQQKTAGKKKK